MDVTPLFHELFEALPRQGPGLNSATERAFQLIPELPQNPSLLDIGCGTGMQTLELARLSGGHVTGTDIHWPFLETLLQKTQTAGFTGLVQVLAADMQQLPFPDASFDVVWSEGAIYIVGFEKGLKAFAELVVPGGYIAVTDAVWLSGNPPSALQKYWDAAYPGMASAPTQLATIESLGLNSLGHFVLPKAAWWEDYYDPMELKLAEMRTKYAAEPAAIELFDSVDEEIQMFREYSDYYNYAFFVMQVPG